MPTSIGSASICDARRSSAPGNSSWSLSSMTVHSAPHRVIASWRAAPMPPLAARSWKTTRASPSAAIFLPVSSPLASSTTTTEFSPSPCRRHERTAATTMSGRRKVVMATSNFLPVMARLPHAARSCRAATLQQMAMSYRVSECTTRYNRRPKPPPSRRTDRRRQVRSRRGQRPSA